MNYNELLKTHQLKITPQRVAILENMHDFGHISIDELYLHVKKTFNSISLATLYKNIHAMLEKTLIKEVSIPAQKSKYEIIKAPHSHLLCTTCKEFEDIVIETSSIVKEVENSTHYQIDSSEFIFSGVCSNCQKLA